MAALVGLAILAGLVATRKLKDRRSPKLVIDSTTPDIQVSVRQLKRHLRRWTEREMVCNQILKRRSDLISRGINPGGTEEKWTRITNARDEATAMREDLSEALRAAKALGLKKDGLFK